MKDPWFLKDEVSTVEEAKTLFDKRGLELIKLPVYLVQEGHDEESKRSNSRSGSALDKFDIKRCDEFYDELKKSNKN